MSYIVSLDFHAESEGQTGPMRPDPAETNEPMHKDVKFDGCRLLLLTNPMGCNIAVPLMM